MNTASLRKRIAAWLLTMACLVGVPVLVIYAGIIKHYNLHEEDIQSNLKIDLQQIVSDIRAANDQEQYWSKSLSAKMIEFYQTRTHVSDICNSLELLRDRFDHLFEFVAFDSAGQVVHKTFASDYSDKDWYHVFLACALNCDYTFNRSPYAKLADTVDMAVVRKILGPQYVGEMTQTNSHNKRYQFVFADSARKIPPSWSFFTTEGGVVLFFDYEKLASQITLKVFVKELGQQYKHRIGLFEFKETDAVAWPEDISAEYPRIEDLLSECEKTFTSFVQKDDYYLATTFISSKYRLFAVAEVGYNAYTRQVYALLAVMIFVLFTVPLQIYTYKTIVRQQPRTVSIKARLAFLFAFATMIPFLSMYMLAQEHYSQKLRTLLRETHQRSAKLLRNFDERKVSYMSKIENRVISYLDSWIEEMPGRNIDKNNTAQIADELTKLQTEEFYLIGSHSSMIGSFAGVRKAQDDFDLSSMRDGMESANRNSQLVNLLARRVISELNGEAGATGQTVDQFELLLESLLQKTFPEMAHAFIKASSGISPWGLKKTSSMALTRFMSLPGSTKIDYLVLAIWRMRETERDYISQVISEVNRNPLGLQIYVREDKDNKSSFFPNKFKPTPQLNKIAEGFTDRPDNEIQFIDLEGQRYMILGFNGTQLLHHQILGLYPVALLDKEIERQRIEQILLTLSALLVALWLAHMITAAFVQPLQDLQTAALAIEQRNFAFRISDCQRDEFGAIGETFNEVMVGLSELEVAAVLQENLFPHGTLVSDRFSVYGKSVSMAELGGDYFDYFITDLQNLALLMGDVAGHGVGAALIMAMAKAGVLRCSDIQSSPVEVMQVLHQLIYSSKTRKQKKIMTFQYLCCDSAEGIARYSNAGGCSPIFVDVSEQTAREITLSGAALGAFKKSRFDELVIEFEPGDALVLYTDGIIECRDPQGNEIGYDGFASMVLASYNTDPEQFYNNIYSSYLSFISGQPPQDDLTLVILTYS